jgi:crotonobetainyl-CoA:carnitine CoA-transferase CaiB-like acyl-CoA transferase
MVSARRRKANAARPLAGVRVIDASRVLAGPYLAMMLGDLGADVIKVERPGEGDQTRAWGPPWVGEGEHRTSAYFVSANRNKRSVALDLSAAAGRAAFQRLLAGADVLVENFLPAQWRGMGFRGWRFTRRHPRLVQCTVSGYGTDGPEADRPAYDLVLQAESGLMSLTGTADGAPVRMGVAVVDIAAALYGLGATLAALRQRDASGRGLHVEVSLADAGTALLSYAAQSWLSDGREPGRFGSGHPSLVPYQAFRAADGWLVVGVGSQDLWRRFCAAIERADLAQDRRFATPRDRVAHRAQLEEQLADLFARRPVAHWAAVLRAHRVPAGPPATIGEALGAARGRGQLIDLPAGALGPLATVGAPFRFDGRRPTPSAPPPGLGEHAAEVLGEVGLKAAGGAGLQGVRRRAAKPIPPGSGRT